MVKKTQLTLCSQLVANRSTMTLKSMTRRPFLVLKVKNKYNFDHIIFEFAGNYTYGEFYSFLWCLRRVQIFFETFNFKRVGSLTISCCGHGSAGDINSAGLFGSRF